MATRAKLGLRFDQEIEIVFKKVEELVVQHGHLKLASVLEMKASNFRNQFTVARKNKIVSDRFLRKLKIVINELESDERDSGADCLLRALGDVPSKFVEDFYYDLDVYNEKKARQIFFMKLFVLSQD